MSISLEVSRLAVGAGRTVLVDDVSLTVEPGTPVTILGETGSGKTLVMEAIMGTLAPELSAAGRIVVGDRASGAEDRAARHGFWGRQLAMLPQEPWLALDPTMRVRAQVSEGHRLVRGLARRDADAQAEDDLGVLGLDAADSKFPHQLSGGMAQRVAFAASRTGGAPILLADEPTKGLDTDLRDTVVVLLRRALASGGSLLCITHDIAIPRALGGEVIVMLGGKVVERGTAASVLSAPSHAYTRQLLAAEPKAWPDSEHPAAGDAVLTGTGLSARRGGRALFEGLDLLIRAGEWVAVTGPSGCGKTTLGDVLLDLHRPTAGTVRRKSGLPRTRFQKLYQDPVSTFAARRLLRASLAEAARLHGRPWADIAATLEALRIDDQLLDRRPDQVSGGELQRIAIARTMVADPVFLFADEPTSRLDPITQRETFAVLRSVTEARGCSVLLVTHDRALAEKSAVREVALGQAATSSSVGAYQGNRLEGGVTAAAPRFER